MLRRSGDPKKRSSTTRSNPPSRGNLVEVARLLRGRSDAFTDPEQSYRRGTVHGAFFVYQALAQAGLIDAETQRSVLGYIRGPLAKWRRRRGCDRPQPPRLDLSWGGQ